MELRKRFIPNNTAKGLPISYIPEREYIFFDVEFNHFRDVSGNTQDAIQDREEMHTCKCVLCLPDSYTEDGEETPLVLCAHGAGGVVDPDQNKVGGVSLAFQCVHSGYAVLDVCGSEPHGHTMGCPEHVFALYKAYRYAIRHYNLSHRVLVAGGSMGALTAMNFSNMFPGLVTAIGLFCPRLNLDGVTIDGHFCLGTWDKTKVKSDGISARERMAEVFRFPDSQQWYEQNTISFNPYRVRSFLNSEGERVVIPPCPIKIWQGLDDKTVDPVMVQEFVNSVRRSGSYIELHLAEGVGHKLTQALKAELPLWFNRFI